MPPRVIVLTSRGESNDTETILGQVEQMGVQCICVADATEATAKIMAVQSLALLIDLRATDWRKSRLLQTAREINIEVLAFGTLPPGTNCDELSGLKLVTERDIPVAIERTLGRSRMKSRSRQPAGPAGDLAQQWMPQQRGHTQITERPEHNTEKQIDRSAVVGEPFRVEAAECERPENHLEQQAAKLRGMNEQLWNAIAERKAEELSLTKRLDELTATNEQLRRKVSDQANSQQSLEQEAESLRQCNAELEAVSQQLREEVSQYQRAKIELEKRCDQFERYLAEQSDRLAAVNARIKREASKREQAKKYLIRLREKLEGL